MLFKSTDRLTIAGLKARCHSNAGLFVAINLAAAFFIDDQSIGKKGLLHAKKDVKRSDVR